MRQEDRALADVCSPRTLPTATPSAVKLSQPVQQNACMIHGGVFSDLVLLSRSARIKSDSEPSPVIHTHNFFFVNKIKTRGRRVDLFERDLAFVHGLKK